MNISMEQIESMEFHMKRLQAVIEDAQAAGMNVQYALQELQRLEQNLQVAKSALLAEYEL